MANFLILESEKAITRCDTVFPVRIGYIFTCELWKTQKVRIEYHRFLCWVRLCSHISVLRLCFSDAALSGTQSPGLARPLPPWVAWGLGPMCAELEERRGRRGLRNSKHQFLELLVVIRKGLFDLERWIFIINGFHRRHVGTGRVSVKSE